MGMIALDLDNTIICYNAAFHLASQALGCCPEGESDKASVKAAALQKGGNDLWTRVQGLAYGTGISHAKFFPGFERFVAAAKSQKTPLVVISHKTKYPALGEQIDLRQAATNWLKAMAFDPDTPIIFCDSREEKVARIRESGCHTLIDDLPEVYLSPEFPRSITFLLFDPSNSHAEWAISPRIQSWHEATVLLFPGIK
jgi:hypothetical protein